jgi:hypothetical protein
MNSIGFVQWSSSVLCPHHHEAAKVRFDASDNGMFPNILVACCCGDFGADVAKKLKSMIKATVHTIARSQAD